MELLLEIVRPLRNTIAKYVLANKLIEQDSFLSDAVGAFLLLGIVVLAVWFFTTSI